MKTHFMKAVSLLAALLFLSVSFSQNPVAAAGNGTDKSALTSTEKKLDSQLLQLARPDLFKADKKGLVSGLTMDYQGELVKTISGESLVNAYVKMTRNADFNILKPLVNKITNTDRKDDMAVVSVDTGKLEALAALDAVVNLEIVVPPVVNTGAVESEGDAMLKADLARAQCGTDGTGIKVGLISDGASHYSTAVATGDLPNNVTILSDKLGGDEGTAMMEIVHDLAPGAQLYFHDCGANELAFIDAINSLIEAGCSVICDDISWTTQPFFEDGVIARHVKALITQNNILYVTSAGNAALGHWQGLFVNDGTGCSTFNNGSDPSLGKDLYVDLPPGGSMRIVLEWNDPFGGSGNDYDLYIGYADRSSPSGTGGYQTGTQNPLESMSVQNLSSSTLRLAIWVKAYNNPAPKTLELYIYTASSWIESNNIVAADSIYGHAAVPGVLACAAIDVAHPTTIESFSSRGPVTTLTGTRQKPDISGADGVSVTGSGGFESPDFKFFGTSAAAPHIAAVAALLLSKFPTAKPDQLRQYLTSTATDLGTSGFDTSFGNGRADALTEVQSAGCTVTINPQNGSAPSSLVVLKGSNIVQPAAPTRTGYTFCGWFKDAACTNAWNFSTDKANSNITIYAKWIGNICNVTFNSQGGSAINPVIALYNTTIYAPPVPTREGYALIGWYKEAACTNAWNFTTSKVMGNITLFAKWALMPSTPTGVSAVSASYSSVKVSWTAATNASAYEIWREATGESSYTLAGTVTAPTFTNTYLATGTKYYYKVRAYKLYGTTKVFGSWSAIVYATPTLAVPASVTAVRVSSTSVKVSWVAVVGATAYELWRSDTYSGTYTLAKASTTASITDTGLPSGKAYYYKVKAYRLVNGVKVYSGFSAVVRP